MKRRLARVSLPVMMLCLCCVAHAATIVPPKNLGELALQSDAVVLARAGSSRVIDRGALLMTATSFTVERSLAGPLIPGDLFETQAPGGRNETVAFEVAGSPRFAEREVYLLFLGRSPEAVWQPLVLAYGLLKRVEGTGGQPLLAPLSEAGGLEAIERTDGKAVEPVGIYDEGALLDTLGNVLNRHAEWDGSLALAGPHEIPAAIAELFAAPSQCVFLASGGQNFRWRAFDTGGSATIRALATGDLSLAGGGFQQVQEALGNWGAISGTRLSLVYGGPQSFTLSCTSGQDTPPSGTSVIVFNDPCSDIPDLSGCSGTLAYGGAWASGNHSFDGATWWTIVSWYIVVNNGSGCLGANNYRRMMAHELGHGLGFGHVSDSGALMYYSCCHDVNPTDTACAQYTYPCTAPSPSITGSATGCSSVPLGTQSFSAYQWYRGGTVVPGATSQTYTATQSGTYTVTVRGSGGCNGTSPGLAVTVNPAPASPGNSLRVTKSGGSALLDWADCAGALSYTVKKNTAPRANPAGFATLASPTASSLADAAAIAAGSVWWYAVEAVSGGCIAP